MTTTTQSGTPFVWSSERLVFHGMGGICSLLPSHYVEQRKSVMFRPDVLFRLTDLELQSCDEAAVVPDGLDVEYVHVGNQMLVAFKRRHPVAGPGIGVVVHLVYSGRYDASCRVRLTGVIADAADRTKDPR